MIAAGRNMPSCVAVRRHGRALEVPGDRRPATEDRAGGTDRHACILVVEDDRDVAGFVVKGLQ